MVFVYILLVMIAINTLPQSSDYLLVPYDYSLEVVLFGGFFIGYAALHLIKFIYQSYYMIDDSN